MATKRHICTQLHTHKNLKIEQHKLHQTIELTVLFSGFQNGKLHILLNIGLPAGSWLLNRVKKRTFCY